MAEFVHLHVHTHFSLLDGLSSPKALVERAMELGMPALAITDHGALYGVVEFYQAARDAGIKPLIGIETYLARRGMRDRDSEDRKPYHLLLLAQNDAGYRNLLRLASVAMLEGFYYKPRIDKTALAGHSDGLIALSGCGSSEIPRLLQDGRVEEARAALAWHRDTFPGRFFVELQDHNIPEMKPVNRQLIEFARQFDLPLVATNDVHYARREQAAAHDVLLAIGTGKSLRDPSRMRMDGDTYYMRSAAEMAHLFPETPEALSNTLRVAEMCDVQLETGHYHLPRFEVPEGQTAQSYLRALCEEGLPRRYANRADAPEVRARLEHELTIIHQMGFDAYFLIVWDLCRAARERGIWYNARGSAAGSIVAYALGITMVDPLANGLIFERFLNPDRISMPDIDLDFQDDRRGELIEYTVRKYGRDNVAQIITFGTLGARAAVRDVGRVMDIPLSEVDRVAKLIPNIPGKPVSIAQALEQVPELQELYRTTPYVRQMLDTASQLEGVARHASTHAAGVVISDVPLVEYCPLSRPPKGEGATDQEVLLSAVTQWPMEDLETIGLLKVDYLGLTTLTIMRRTCDLIRQRHGVSLDLDTIPLDDPAIYRLLSSGDVAGLFQVEGAGLRRVLQEMRPTRYEHIVAVLALYRPGPMEHIPTYIQRMHGQEQVEYRHPALAPILDETYAICVYQEQIIRIATDLAGYTAGEADLLRRAVAKKKKGELLAHREKFVRGAVERGIPERTAAEIFDDFEYFARYGFNKCLPGDVEVVDISTGRLVTIEALYRGDAQLERTVTCDLQALRLQEGAVAAVKSNGLRLVYRLTTALGRTIEATANHPFLTYEGWKPLGELREGECVAVPRCLPVEGRQEWPEHEVVVLGHLLAEGNLCHSHSVYFYTKDRAAMQDYVRAAEQFDNTHCSVAVHKGVFSVYARRIERRTPPGIVRWVQGLGIWGKNARDKEIPVAAFELPRAQLGLLFARMWEGDGHIHLEGRLLYYATSSERLARQLQHLLLRLGIVSRVRAVRFPHQDGRIGYQVRVTGNDNLTRFRDQVACHFIDPQRRQALQAMCIDQPAASATKDVVPVRVKELVRAAKQRTGATWAQVCREAGVAQRECCPIHNRGKKGFTRQTLRQLADYFGDPALHRYAESDLYWDSVIRIEPAGEKQTYDLEIVDTHNFVANDFLVHNSHAADYAVLTCQTAYLKAYYPVEYMAALLTVERNNTEKVGAVVTECRRMGIEVLPPSVQHSGLEFTIEELPGGRPAIRFGLGAVKNVGDGPVEAILQARAGQPFRDLGDFCRRVDLRVVSRRALEGLVRVGALDVFGPRARLLAALDRMLSLSSRIHQARESGQLSLFDDSTGVAVDDEKALFIGLPPIAGLPQRELLGWEKELAGTYLSEHPLVTAMRDLSDVLTANIGQLQDERPEQMVTVLGEVQRVRRHTTRNGEEMAFVTLEDLYGSGDVVVFPRLWAASKEKWLPGRTLVVGGKVNVRNEQVSLVCEWVKEPDEVARPRSEPAPRPAPLARPAPPPEPPASPSCRTIQVTIRRSGDARQDVRLLSAVHEMLVSYPGDDRFTFLLRSGPNGDQLLEFPNACTGYCRELGEKLSELLGPGMVRVCEGEG